MLKMITNNFGLKFLAFVFAVTAWLIVVNVEDPDITKTFTVTVEVQNEDLLSEAGKTYEVLNDSNTIRVTATAKRSIMEGLSSSDFQAVTDLKDVVNNNLSGQQNLQVYISALRYNSQVSINSTKQYMTVLIDDQVEKEIDVNVIPTGSPEMGFVTGEITGYPKSVTIQGPSSLVNSIAQAVVEVNIDGMTEDVNQELDIEFVDENGESVNTDKLTISRSKATVYVECLSLQSISLQFETSGKPKDGYEVSGITADKDTIMVKGTADQLADLTSLTISGDALNVDGASEDKTVTIDVSDYLPKGVSLQSEEGSQVQVTISITAYQKKEIIYPTSMIDISGLGSLYNASFKDSQISFSVNCPKSMASSITADSITVRADLTGMSAGTHHADLEVALPEGASLESDVKAYVVIKVK